MSEGRLEAESPVTEVSWTTECASLLEHFVWEPQHLGRNKYLSLQDKRPPPEIARRVMLQEVPLNHQLNVFFRIAPHTLAERWLSSIIQGIPINAPTLMYSRDYDTPACQPDMLFETTSARVFVELKIKASTGPEQLCRYAALAAWLDQRHGHRPSAIVFMGPKKQAFDSIHAYMRGEIDHRLSASLVQNSARMEVSSADIDATLKRMEVASTTFGDFDRFLDSENQKLGSLASQEGDATLRNLIGGLRSFLRPVVALPSRG